ncbi:MAG TPA: anhydro-N-acetylmuramic acid kinase [Candidatus Tyrphobacter sp.]
MIAVGIMSGTSLDGIDAALVDLRPSGSGYAIDVRRFATVAFDDDLMAMLRAALPPERGSTAVIAELHRRLGSAFARAALGVIGDARVDFVASHGQTIYHDGTRNVTLQLGDPFVVREAVGASVCYDFRSADCAAGGAGAPLVPYVDGLLFRSDREDRVALNIGGISNLTSLPRGRDDLSAFDIGPGNMLIDACVLERTGSARRFDRDGALAARGHVDETLLDAMLADPYFALLPPKTTGRERFGAQFFQKHRSLGTLSLEDAVATLTELTAASVAATIESLPLERPRVIVSGGGASNETLMARLSQRLPGCVVERSDTMGISADAKEAVAFAVLGYETLRERAANVPRATGARRAVPLGAIAPCGLRELLETVECECRS